MISLGNRALICADRGDLDDALSLLDEAEVVIREVGDLTGMSLILNTRAGVYEQRGDIEAALHLLEEKEAICREVGDFRGLAVALANRGRLLATRGGERDARPLVDEAHDIVVDHGFEYLAQQVEPLWEALRGQEP